MLCKEFEAIAEVEGRNGEKKSNLKLFYKKLLKLKLNVTAFFLLGGEFQWKLGGEFQTKVCGEFQDSI